MPARAAPRLALAAVLAGPVFSGPALAEEAAPPSATTLDTVTVIADKQGRSQRDTGTSATVVDGQALQARGLDDSRSLLGNMANVTSPGVGNLAPAVRGVDGTGPATGSDAFFAGTRPRLSLSIDGRPASYNEIVFGGDSLWDVQQIELLRGPQSLLQGRNAIAGTLAIKTRDPSFTPEGSVRVLAGNRDRRQAAFAVSGPLAGDQVAFRIAGDVQRQHSYLDFAPIPGASDPGEFETRTLRGKLLVKPDALPDFSALLTFQHAQSRAPQLESESRPFGDKRNSTPDMPVFDNRGNVLIADTQWRLNDRLRWDTLISATDLHVKREAPKNTGIASIDNREYVLEPKLVLEKGDGRASGIFGAYFFRANQDELIDFPMDGERFRDEIRTAALYGQTQVALRDDLELTLGARYERERHRRAGGDGAIIDIDIDKTYNAFLPKLGLSWHANERWTFGGLVSRGYNAGGGGVVAAYAFPAMVFRTYFFEPEYVVNYEAFFRGELADGRVQLTGNVFYGDYRDMQLPFDLDPRPGVWSVEVRNADRARNYGAELGLRWQATPALELYSDIGVLRTKVTRYPNSGIEGNAFANAPTFTANAGLLWRGAGGGEFGLNARHSNAYYSDIENRPLGRTDAYWVVNAKGGYRFGRTYVFAGVDNAFDDRSALQVYTYSIDPSPYDSATLIRPRSWYVGLQYDW
ncbi:TonB-dependent receptor [Luteimonas aquatica]|uniref:TonB-dependent receptor n=1 Tax=Luteimonas aquatica TaxID=450364 RepID=UPI001F55D633|nr:TonB-dependent receptor [Luteimonas aquatica]